MVQYMKGLITEARLGRVSKLAVQLTYRYRHGTVYERVIIPEARLGRVN
jgi:hypothetical protein